MNAPYPHLTSTGGVFSLIRDGLARSRSDLSRLTGLAPSTITLRVDELLGLGVVEEAGETASRGGRRPRKLALARDGRVIAGIDLGATHATIILEDLRGARVARHRMSLDIARAPEVVLRGIHREVLSLVESAADPVTLAGIGLAVPGPVGVPDGRIISPSRMPGWNGIDASAILGGIAGVPVRCENDANAMALGEHIADGRRSANMLVVKAGSSIGVGIIVDGALYRGATGVAGDITHIAVAGSTVACVCGRVGCLDAIAGGRAIGEAMTAGGIRVDDVAQLADLARDGHPLATRLLREAGLRTGSVLATIVGFFNPERLVLGGVIATTDAFVAGVRSSIYDLCLPLSTSSLDVSASAEGWDIGARGAALLVRDELLSAASIDALARAHV
ncbi:MAG: ROK family protein [Microbacterium enclense]